MRSLKHFRGDTVFCFSNFFVGPLDFPINSAKIRSLSQTFTISNQLFGPTRVRDNERRLYIICFFNSEFLRFFYLIKDTLRVFFFAWGKLHEFAFQLSSREFSFSKVSLRKVAGGKLCKWFIFEIPKWSFSNKIRWSFNLSKQNVCQTHMKKGQFGSPIPAIPDPQNLFLISINLFSLQGKTIHLSNKKLIHFSSIMRYHRRVSWICHKLYTEKLYAIAVVIRFMFQLRIQIHRTFHLLKRLVGL